MIMIKKQVIDVEDLPETLFKRRNIFSTAFTGNKSLKEVKEFVEKEYIITKLAAANGNVSRASVMLGVERTNLYKKMKFYHIEPKNVFETG